MKKLRLAELTSKFIGAPYKLGGHGAGEGFDCYSLMLAACEYWNENSFPGIGIKSFKGLTVENYPEHFKRNPAETKEILFEVLGSVMNEIKPSDAFAGDILITTVKGGTESGLGIHAGNGNMLASYLEGGVRLMPLRGYNIVKAYRGSK